MFGSVCKKMTLMINRLSKYRFVFCPLTNQLNRRVESLWALTSSFRLICKLDHSTHTAKTNSNFWCEGHSGNLNAGRECTQESAKTFSEPGVCRGAFPHDLFIWKARGCLLSAAGLRRRGADRRVERESGVCFHSSWFTLVCFFSVRDVGEHLQLCSFVHYYSLSHFFFFFCLYLFREGLLRTHILFQPGLKAPKQALKLSIIYVFASFFNNYF